MKTVVLDEPGRFRFTDSEPPSGPGPGEALVRVHSVGVCGTDLHAFRGRQPFFSYPRILGHELGVEIVGLGANTDESGLQVGDTCAVEPYLNCGACSSCRRGKTNCCEQLRVLGVHMDGGMREQITVPVHKLYPSRSVSLEHLALVEMLCIGAHAVWRGPPEQGENVLVIGAGPIGLSTIQFALLAGANVVVLEVSEARAAFCREQLGVDQILFPDGDVAANLRSALLGELPTTVFDATGNVHSMTGAFELVANGGKLILVGLVQSDICFHDPEFHRREMTLMSTRNATGHDFAYAIRMLEEGQIDLAPWITHRAAPEGVAEQFPSWLEPSSGVVKAMVQF